MMKLCEVKGIAAQLGYQVEDHPLNSQAGCLVVTCCRKGSDRIKKAFRLFYASSGLRPSRDGALELLHLDLKRLRKARQ